MTTSHSFRLDRIDNQLLHALIVDGRAPFSLLSELMGTSEQTVARRYRRLHEAGAVRVLVLPEPSDQGLEWIVRIGVRPGAAARLAVALAERGDVSWLRIMSGGAEVVCISRPSSLEERDALLLERLARTNLVTTVTAHAIMKLLAGGGIGDWSAFDDPLDAAQAAALRSSAPARRSNEIPDADDPRTRHCSRSCAKMVVRATRSSRRGQASRRRERVGASRR